MGENTVRDYANYDYSTGQEMQAREPSQLDLFLAEKQTTVPSGAETQDGLITEDQ